MKKVQQPDTSMRKEYDFTHGAVGKYAARYARGTNVIVLDRDLARIFPDSQAVNDALRNLVQAGGSRTSKARVRKKD